MDHTTEVAAQQTTEIKEALCTEMDKRFPPALIELDTDSEKAKATLTRAKKAMHQIELQRCKDEEATQRAHDGKEPLGRKPKRTCTSNSSSSCG